MFWGLDLDDFGRACKITHRTYPLIKAVTEVLQGGTPAPTAKAEIKVSIGNLLCWTISYKPFFRLLARARHKAPEMSWPAILRPGFCLFIHITIAIE